MKRNDFEKQEWNAQDYKKYGIPQYDIAIEALAKWDFKGDEQVLDIGCGNGAITHYMAKKYLQNGSVLGIDLSKNMIELAQKEFKSTNIDFNNGDASNLTFNTKFDLITSFYCIHWIQDQQKVLNGIASSLKDKGRTILYIMTNSADSNYQITNIFHEILSSSKWKHNFINYQIPFYFESVGSYKDKLEKANLKKITLEAVNKEIIFKDKDALNKWLTALPIANNLSKNLQEELFFDITTKYTSYFPINSDGSVKFYLPTLIAIAEK